MEYDHYQAPNAYDEFDEDYVNWKFIHNDFDVSFVTEDLTEQYLLEVLLEEIRYIDDMVKNKTCNIG